MSSSSTPTPEAITSVTALCYEMRAKARPLVDRFESRYAAWRQTWEIPSERGDEFVKLAGMGVKILPLVVHKLCSETEAKTVDLYNDIERDVDFESQSPATIIARNYQRNKEFVERSARWETYKEENRFSNTSQIFRLCPEYADLIDLGTSILPKAMLVYYDDMGGWWDLLLAELASGHESGARLFIRDDIHRRWIDWFENKEGEVEAPYKLVGEAATVEQWMRAGGMGNPNAVLGDE